MKKKLLLTALVITTFNSFAQVNTHSLSFDAIDDYVDVPDNAALNLTGAITIQAWVKANAWGTNVWDNYIVGKDDWSVSSAGYALRAGAGGQQLEHDRAAGIAGDEPSAVVGLDHLRRLRQLARLRAFSRVSFQPVVGGRPAWRSGCERVFG